MFDGLARASVHLWTLFILLGEVGRGDKGAGTWEKSEWEVFRKREKESWSKILRVSGTSIDRNFFGNIMDKLLVMFCNKNTQRGRIRQRWGRNWE